MFAATGRKLDLSELRAQPDTNQVVVKFREGEKVRLTKEKLTGMRSGQANLLNNVLSQAGVTETALKPLFAAPPEELERESNECQRRTGRQLADLSLYFVITLPSTASAAEVANNLNALPFVEYAGPALRPAPPPIYSIPEAADLCPRVTRRAALAEPCTAANLQGQGATRDRPNPLRQGQRRKEACPLPTSNMTGR